jgi:hypothetical protein
MNQVGKYLAEDIYACDGCGGGNYGSIYDPYYNSNTGQTYYTTGPQYNPTPVYQNYEPAVEDDNSYSPTPIYSPAPGIQTQIPLEITPTNENTGIVPPHLQTPDPTTPIAPGEGTTTDSSKYLLLGGAALVLLLLFSDNKKKRGRR